MNVIVNLDEILTQRSQVSMSQYNGSGDESGSNSIKRLHSTAVVRLTERSVTPPSSRGGRYSPEQQYLVNNGGGGDNRIERRHSSAVPIRRSDSISSSDSSYDGVLTNRRPASRKSIITSMTHATPMYPQEADDSSETSESYQSSGFFSCMRCFKSSHATNHSSENRSNISKPKIVRQPSLPIVFQNRYCHFIHRYLMLMSENLEADVLGVSNNSSSSCDIRLVFVLYSLLTGESVLTPEEYPECDEWCDWLSLGFSDASIDAFDRDMNRNGSQTMGFLFQLFFASQFTKIAKLCVVIIRNVHFVPSPLFGLFSVNCAKWSRDVIINAIVRFDRKEQSTRSSSYRPKIPPLFESAKFVFDEYKTFSQLFDWWITRGDIGSIDHVFESFSVSLPKKMYESFEDEDDDEEAEVVPLATRRLSSSSPKRRVSFQTMISRVPGIDTKRRIPGSDFELLKSSLIVGGLYYTYCILNFTKFWLEQKLIEVDSDTARERLNNQYLESAFVTKLELSSSMSVSDISYRINRLIDRIETLWESSGWNRENLLAN